MQCLGSFLYEGCWISRWIRQGKQQVVNILSGFHIQCIQIVNNTDLSLKMYVNHLKTHGCEFLFSFLVQQSVSPFEYSEQCFLSHRDHYSSLCVCVCVCARAWVSCPLGCVWFFYNPMDCSPPASSVHRILQARILEWVAISSSRAFPQPRDWTHVSCVSCIGRRISFYHWATWEAFTRRILKTRKWRNVFHIPLVSSSTTLCLENDRNCDT